jgi:hypothetical protein
MQAIFSCHLVQLQQTTGQGEGEGTHLVLARQFWVYVLITAGSIVLTLGGTRWLEYRSLKALG